MMYGFISALSMASAAPDENPAQGDVGATASSTNPNSQRPPAADTAGEARPSSPVASPATIPASSHDASEAVAVKADASRSSADDDIPAFIKQDKPDCLKLKDGHCRLSFATSALCAECNQRRAMARALA